MLNVAVSVVRVTDSARTGYAKKKTPHKAGSILQHILKEVG